MAAWWGTAVATHTQTHYAPRAARASQLLFSLLRWGDGQWGCRVSEMQSNGGFDSKPAGARVCFTTEVGFSCCASEFPVAVNNTAASLLSLDIQDYLCWL